MFLLLLLIGADNYRLVYSYFIDNSLVGLECLISQSGFQINILREVIEIYYTNEERSLIVYIILSCGWLSVNCSSFQIINTC